MCVYIYIYRGWRIWGGIISIIIIINIIIIVIIISSSIVIVIVTINVIATISISIIIVMYCLRRRGVRREPVRVQQGQEAGRGERPYDIYIYIYNIYLRYNIRML